MKTHIIKTFSLALTALLFTSCKTQIQNQQLTCNDFKDGTFEFYDKELNKKYVLIRNNDSQIEQVYDLTTNNLDPESNRIMKISWLNDCEYKAILDTTKSKYDELDLLMISKGGLKNKIISIEKKCALTESSIENFTKTFRICKK